MSQFSVNELIFNHKLAEHFEEKINYSTERTERKITICVAMEKVKLLQQKNKVNNIQKPFLQTDALIVDVWSGQLIVLWVKPQKNAERQKKKWQNAKRNSEREKEIH